MKVYIERLRDDIELPEYKNIGDAGMDVRAAIDTIIYPGETKVVPVGLKVAIPIGYEIQVRPRSGLSYKTPLRIANSPGTIDSGYRDEVGIIITNTSPRIEESLLEDAYLINKGDRIAQLVLKQVETIEWEEVDDITTVEGDRGGGFGSTGTK
jgi:dUTP pyrophosphatase